MFSAPTYLLVYLLIQKIGEIFAKTTRVQKINQVLNILVDGEFQIASFHFCAILSTKKFVYFFLLQVS